MAGKLRGKVALVTGGSAGIGLGIAKRFAQEGARVFITGRRQFQLDEAVASIGGDAAAIQGDSTNLADLDRIYATIKAQAAHLDVLMVNAGVYEFGVLGEITVVLAGATFRADLPALVVEVSALVDEGMGVKDACAQVIAATPGAPSRRRCAPAKLRSRSRRPCRPANA